MEGKEIYKSIFQDETKKNDGLWCKKDRSYISGMTNVYVCAAGKSIDRSGKKYKLRNIHITDTCMYYEKSTDYWYPLRVVQYVNVSGDYTIEKDSEEYKYRLYLSYDTKYTTIIFNEYDTFMRVLRLLYHKIPFVDYHSKYRMVDTVSEDGMCSIYVASHTLLHDDDRYITHAYSKSYLHNKLRSIDQVKNEIRMCTIVDKHSMGMVCYFESINSIYIVRPMCVWTSLHDIIPYRSMFTDDTIRYVSHSLLTIVHRLEQVHHVVHRDINPRNIVFVGLTMPKVVRGEFDTSDTLPDVSHIDLCEYPVYMINYYLSCMHNDDSILLDYIKIGYTHPHNLSIHDSHILHDNTYDMYSVAIVIIHTLIGDTPYQGNDMDGLYRDSVRNDVSYIDRVSCDIHDRGIHTIIHMCMHASYSSILHVLHDEYYSVYDGVYTMCEEGIVDDRIVHSDGRMDVGEDTVDDSKYHDVDVLYTHHKIDVNAGEEREGDVYNDIQTIFTNINNNEEDDMDDSY